MGKTIIISSHILPELAEMCTEVGIIDQGHIVVQGTVQEIMKQMTKVRRIQIHPLENMEGLLKILEEQPTVADVIENTLDVEFSFQGTDQELTALLKQIVLADIAVLSFKEKEGNLEEIFMQVTGGEEK